MRPAPHMAEADAVTRHIGSNAERANLPRRRADRLSLGNSSRTAHWTNFFYVDRGFRDRLPLIID